MWPSSNFSCNLTLSLSDGSSYPRHCFSTPYKIPFIDTPLPYKVPNHLNVDNCNYSLPTPPAWIAANHGSQEHLRWQQEIKNRRHQEQVRHNQAVLNEQQFKFIKNTELLLQSGNDNELLEYLKNNHDKLEDKYPIHNYTAIDFALEYGKTPKSLDYLLYKKVDITTKRGVKTCMELAQELFKKTGNDSSIKRLQEWTYIDKAELLLSRGEDESLLEFLKENHNMLEAKYPWHNYTLVDFALEYGTCPKSLDYLLYRKVDITTKRGNYSSIELAQSLLERRGNNSSVKRLQEWEFIDKAETLLMHNKDEELLEHLNKYKDMLEVKYPWHNYTIVDFALEYNKCPRSLDYLLSQNVDVITQRGIKTSEEMAAIGGTLEKLRYHTIIEAARLEAVRQDEEIHRKAREEAARMKAEQLLAGNIAEQHPNAPSYAAQGTATVLASAIAGDEQARQEMRTRLPEGVVEFLRMFK